MGMSNQQAVEQFAAATAKFPATMFASLTYLARVGCDQPHIIKARLNLHGKDTDFCPKYFQSSEIIAGRILLPPELTAANIIQGALNGKISTLDGDLAFLSQVNGGYAATFIPLHPEPLARQSRIGVLQIRGSDQSDFWQNEGLDWAMRAADEPYDNLNELSIDFGIGGLIERSTIFEAVVPAIVEVDLSAQVKGGIATIGIWATKGLDQSKVSIGYRVFDKGAVVTRATVKGDALNWGEQQNLNVASTEINVPSAAIIHCYARYDGVTYHSGFIVDPSLAQNPRRAAYDAFDPQLRTLVEALSTKDRSRARDVEPAIANMLWMLGFNTCHLGGVKTLQDGPDILAATPSGHILAVECTVGMIKTDSKMHKLLARTTAIRDQLFRSGHGHLRVLPVMVTTLSRDEIASEIGDAVKQGVYVICGDDFEEAINRTLILPNADQLFTDAENSLQDMAIMHPQTA
jgi:hypothetical protein